MTPSNPIQPEKLEPDWVNGMVRVKDDHIQILREDGWLMTSAPRYKWLKDAFLVEKYKKRISNLQRNINAREPHQFLPSAIKELEEKAKEADALRGSGDAGKIMWGQAQAYRDAVALLKSYTRY